jgi:predicted acylesterase/phospholipase RssA
MVKYLAIGPGAMGFFMFLGVTTRLKHAGELEELKEISGASAGALLAVMYCLARGDVAKILDWSLDVPVKTLMKPNIKNFLKNYGLISRTKLADVIGKACDDFTGNSELTFEELYRHFPMKIHLASYCVDLAKMVYFSIDTTPDMKVKDATSASIAIPFVISGLKREDGWNYIDGGAGETTPCGPFLGKTDVLGLCITSSFFIKVKDIKTYALSILYAAMKQRPSYEIFPHIVLETKGLDPFDFGASRDGKLRLFLEGFSQGIIK